MIRSIIIKIKIHKYELCYINDFEEKGLKRGNQVEMKILKSEKRLCTCCTEEHEVKTIVKEEQVKFKNRKVSFDSICSYCDREDEYYMDEVQMNDNDIAMKNAYRRIVGLLTSDEIVSIRRKYGIGQRDLSLLLGWRADTVARYESHQVQDKAHDMILRRIGDDPEWFVFLLTEAKQKLGEQAYTKYWAAAQKNVTGA